MAVEKFHNEVIYTVYRQHPVLSYRQKKVEYSPEITKRLYVMLKFQFLRFLDNSGICEFDKCGMSETLKSENLLEVVKLGIKNVKIRKSK